MLYKEYTLLFMCGFSWKRGGFRKSMLVVCAL